MEQELSRATGLLIPVQTPFGTRGIEVYVTINTIQKATADQVTETMERHQAPVHDTGGGRGISHAIAHERRLGANKAYGLNQNTFLDGGRGRAQVRAPMQPALQNW
jgi:hypothetical protein